MQPGKAIRADKDKAKWRRIDVTPEVFLKLLPDYLFACSDFCTAGMSRNSAAILLAASSIASVAASPTAYVAGHHVFHSDSARPVTFQMPSGSPEEEYKVKW